MTGAGGILGVWLTPAIWLALPALFLAQGAGALWAGLLLVAAPLLALSLRGAPSDPRLRAPVPLIHIAALFLAVIALIWAGLIVAGDVALRLGGPRWHGIALAASGGLLLTAWRGAGRALPALLMIAVLGLALPLLLLARVAGLGPVEAWQVVATSPSFTFPPGSPWVSEGRDLRLAQGQRPLHFQEEHRLTAVGEVSLRLSTRLLRFNRSSSSLSEPPSKRLSGHCVRMRRTSAASSADRASPDGVLLSVCSSAGVDRSAGRVITSMICSSVQPTA